MILGISAGFHDAACTLIDEAGNIMFAGHSERYSKIKNDPNLNDSLIQDVLKYGEITEVAWYENPILKHTRQVYSGEKSILSLPFNVKKYLNKYNINAPIKTYSHHLSHAAGGFQTSNYDKAICVIVDAIGEWDCISVWYAYYDFHGNARYRKLWSRKYPHSLGLYYSAMTKEVGLKPNEEEYIMMGMAAYGSITGWSDIHRSLIKENYFTSLDVSGDFNFTLKENLHLGLSKSLLLPNEDIAACTQHSLEKILVSLFKEISRYCILHKTYNIVYSGGVALNCVANTNILYNMSKYNLWIMPNPGDAGSSLGAAALSYKKKLNWKGPYLGYDINKPYPIRDLLGGLKTNKLVGVANSRAEFGPRALGNRSLLADPREPNIKDLVNKIKNRENFRPFGAAILEEFYEEYFYSMYAQNVTSKYYDYMQYVFKTKKDLPGITHFDNTCRIQVVTKHCNSGIRQLLEQWYLWSGGCPLLLNTSLNIKGEPIVNDEQDAKRFEQKYNVKVF